MLEATAFWVELPGVGVLRLTAPGTRHQTGHVPESEHERICAPFQQGDFPGPVKYGYLNVGVMERGPKSLRGQIVFTLFPHQYAPRGAKTS